MAIPDHLNDHIRRMAALTRAWCLGERLSPSDEKSFIDGLTDYALSNPIVKSRLRAAAHAQGVDEERANAFSYLGTLLARSPNNCLAELLGDAVDESDGSLCKATRRAVINYAFSELFHRWKESDYVGASIYKALWNTLTKHPELYRLLPDDDTAPRYVVLQGVVEPRLSKPKIACEELVRLVSEVWVSHRNIPTCTKRILEIVAEDDQWSALVPVTEVLFKGLAEAARMGVMREAEALSTAMSEQPDLMWGDVRRIFDASMSATLPWVRDLASKYVKRQKLTESQAKKMILAVELLLREHGFDCDATLDYKSTLLKCSQGMTEAEYDQTIKFIFRYIMTKAHNRLYEEFRRRWGLDSSGQSGGH